MRERAATEEEKPTKEPSRISQKRTAKAIRKSEASSEIANDREPDGGTSSAEGVNLHREPSLSDYRKW